MRNTSADAAQEESSLYDMIVDATGIEYDQKEFPSPEDYKNQLVRHFGKMDAEEFDTLPAEVSDWVNEATGVFNANRRAKDRSPLPDIDGLPEPPPQVTRRTRVSISDDDDEPPAPPVRRSRVVAAPPDDDDDDVVEEEEETVEEAVAEPPATRRRPGRPPGSTKRAVEAASSRRARDPEAGRYAKVMPHYLKKRDIEIPELQAKIAKLDGADYSVMTLDRTLAACRAVVAWLERHGVDLREVAA